MKNKLHLCALLGASLLSTAALRPAHAITDEQEIEAGRQVAAQSIKEFGQPLPQSDPRQQRVSRIGAMFARRAARRNIPFSYTVLQNEKVLNAFAAPGGPVFVTTKLLETTQNDAELAYVLGHETGHIELRHVVKAAQKNQTVGIGAGIGAAILGQVLGGGRYANTIGAIAGVGTQLYQKGFSRKEEAQADAYGVDAMARLGFDPRAAVSMLGRLGNGPDGIVSKYLSDHPDSPKRQRDVSSQISRQNLLGVASANGGPFLSLGGQGGNYAASYNGGGSSDAAPFNARNVNGVIMASVDDMARLAGGRTRVNGDEVEVIPANGGASSVFRLDSTQAQLGGRAATLTARPQSFGGQLWVPIGAISYALGGRATLNPRSNSVSIAWNDGHTNTLRY